jgi:hypothetical protein
VANLSRRARKRFVIVSIAALVGSLAIGFSGITSAGAAQGDPCTAGETSDPRADCFQGNFPFQPTNDNCATRFGAANEFVVNPPATATSPDGAVTGTVTGNAVNVTAQPGTVIIAVVVKGGPLFNVYQPPVSNMIAPQGFSHYIICYGPGTPETTTTTATPTGGGVPLAVESSPSFTG